MGEIDKRVLKTKRLIKQGFLDVLDEKPYELVTIKDISDKAQITRKTFYSHYKGIYDLVEETKLEIDKDSEKALLTLDFENDIKNPVILFNKIYENTKDHLVIYSKLFANKMNIDFNYELIAIVGNKVFDLYWDKLKIKDVPVNRDVIIKYVLYGFLNAYSSYYPSMSISTIHDFIKTMGSVVFNGINGFIK